MPIRRSTLAPSNFDFNLIYYLSGPMTDYPEYNYPTFERVMQNLIEIGVKVESPHMTPWPENHEKMDKFTLWTLMIAKAMHQMDKCEGIILMKGWPTSRGVKIELRNMLDKGNVVYYYNEVNDELINMGRE